MSQKEIAEKIIESENNNTLPKDEFGHAMKMIASTIGLGIDEGTQIEEDELKQRLQRVYDTFGERALEFMTDEAKEIIGKL